MTKKKTYHPLPGGFTCLPLNFSHKPTFQKRSFTQSLSSPIWHLCVKVEKDPLAGQTFINDAPSGGLRGTFWISALFCPLGRCPCVGNTCHLWEALPSSFIKYTVLSWEDLSPFMAAGWGECPPKAQNRLGQYFKMTLSYFYSIWFGLKEGWFFLFFFFFFKQISILSSIVAVIIYITNNSARWFPFLHTLSHIYWL